MIYGGVDGCKAGWILIKYDGRDYQYGIYPTFAKLLDQNPEIDRLLVDIPIGLSDENSARTVDAALRKELGIRSSTVFNAPCRAAVYEEDMALARAKNIAIEGKSLSIQSLAIRSKIKEVDIILRKRKNRPLIYESHPEVCFKYLHLNQQILLTSKAKMDGQEARLRILERYVPDIHPIFTKILSENLRKTVKPDDIIDAICLCLVNQLGGQNGLRFFQGSPPTDSQKIEIKVAYFYN